MEEVAIEVYSAELVQDVVQSGSSTLVEDPPKAAKHPLCNCAECPYYEQPYVPSKLVKGAEVIVVGEGPGEPEAQKGEPFVGASGALLRQVMAHVGLDEARVSLTNVVACRPPDNETPTKQSITCCAPRLRSELTGIPTIVPVGVTASSAVFGKKVGIKKERVGPPKTSKLYKGARVIPTFHPAACLRTADFFPSFLTDMGKITNLSPPTFVYPSYIVVGPKKAAWVARELYKRYDSLVIDIETAFEKEGTFVQANHYELLCIGVAFSNDHVIIFDREACADDEFRVAFGELLENVAMTAHNGKFDVSGLKRIGDGRLSFDTMLASYCLDERGGIHDLGHVASERLGAPDFKGAIKPYLDKNRSYANVPPHILHRYCAFDCGSTKQLEGVLRRELLEQGLMGLHDYLIEASNVLMHIEMQGMGLDLDVLHEVDEELKTEMDRLHAILVPWLSAPNHLLDKKKQPKKITAGSWQQVQRAIKYSTGIFTASTDRAHIEELIDQGVTADGNLQILLEFRKVQKLWATYVNGIKQRMYDSRIHSSFLLHGTVTGRLSSRNPNLHNIPR